MFPVLLFFTCCFHFSRRKAKRCSFLICSGMAFMFMRMFAWIRYHLSQRIEKKGGETMDSTRLQQKTRQRSGHSPSATEEEGVNEGEYDDVWPARPVSSVIRTLRVTDVRAESACESQHSNGEICTIILVDIRSLCLVHLLL